LSDDIVVGQDPVSLGLGVETNAFVLPKNQDEDLDDDDIENPQNQRLMQIGSLSLMLYPS
jgi:hypothetical protein